MLSNVIHTEIIEILSNFNVQLFPNSIVRLHQNQIVR